MKPCLRSVVCGLALFAGSLLAAAPVQADTLIAGGNIINRTWTLAGSPYVVQGDITVPAGAFLTIEAGVEVQFASSDSQVAGFDPSRVEITVNGTLTVNGTVASPVWLHAMTGSSSTAWYGVVVPAGATSVSLNGATLSNALYAVNTQGGSPTITGSRFENDSYGLVVSTGTANVTNSVFTTTTSAGVRTYGGIANLTNCTISGNANTGLETSGGTTTVLNSIIASNAGYAINRGGGTVSVSNSDVWDDPTSGGYTATANLSANPLFVGGTNYRITSHSPCRFAGSTGADVGALPYGTDATPGLYGTLWEDLTVAAGTTAVAGDLTVAPGVTLTLSPGATLNFATSDIMLAYADSSRAELRVQGTLAVNATAGMPVVLTSTGTSSSSWYGMVLLSGATSSLRGMVIEEALYGMNFQGGSAALIEGSSTATTPMVSW